MMLFSANYATSIGRKAVNQDAVFVHTIGEKNNIGAFMVLCDGMGGFSHGEYASASVLQAFTGWFYACLPALQQQSYHTSALREQWQALIEEQHRSLCLYGMENGSPMGTTVCAILLYGGAYYAMHVGDSRIYEISAGGARQLTKDHSWVQSAVDQGLLTPEQARVDKRRNRLTQCVGSGNMPVPDFCGGRLREKSVYLCCCDGFYHELLPEELVRLFMPAEKADDAEKLRRQLESGIQTVLERGEKDNVTAGAVYAAPKLSFSWVKKLLRADAKEMPANDDGEEGTMML